MGKPTAEEENALKQGKLDGGTFAFAGLVGMTAGFGLGHAIGGVYDHNGLLLTAGELMSVGLIGLGGITSRTTLDPLYGTTLFLCFKIYEMVDVWVQLASRNSRYDDAIIKQRSSSGVSDRSLVPSVAPYLGVGHAGLLLGWRF